MLKQSAIWVLGTMSGTSLDGVDAAMIRTDGARIYEFGETAYRPYTPVERDVIRALGESGVLEFPVAKIMTADVHTCEAGDSVSELMALMTERRIRHVPVVADGKLTGIVSIGDVVKTHVGQLEFERDQLNVYVNG